MVGSEGSSARRMRVLRGREEAAPERDAREETSPEKAEREESLLEKIVREEAVREEDAWEKRDDGGPAPVPGTIPVPAYGKRFWRDG